MTERSYQGLETLSSTPDAQMPSQDASLSIYHETHSLTSFTVQEKAKKKKRVQIREGGGDLRFKMKRARLYLALPPAGCGDLYKIELAPSFLFRT